MRFSKFLYLLIVSSIFNLIACADSNPDGKVIDSSDVMKEFSDEIESNRVLTKQMLDTTSDSRLEDKIIANINSKQDINLSNDKEILPTLSRERQAIFYIYMVEGEVNNGGFDQFYLNEFINSDHLYMFEKTIEAFQLIGASKFADIVSRTNKIFKANENDFVNKIGLFDKLDNEFYETYKQEDLDDLRIRFIRANIEAFIDK
ncbi:MAG: DUF4375 domain-containing protein [Bacteroidetes bacterium]|nr:MAG: DUF4375 domain-containing protein [Bacteroidota bacterium]